MTDVEWFIYIVRCSDNTLYTGITSDLQRRIDEHNSGPKGAKYTRARRPVELVYSERSNSRSEASKREYAIKQLSASSKQMLISSQNLR